MKLNIQMILSAGAATLISGQVSCPDPWVAQTYNQGDQVSAEGQIYQCKPWPYSGYCGQAGFEPGRNDFGLATPTWTMAWTEIGPCSESTIHRHRETSPTGIPIFEPGMHCNLGDRVINVGKIWRCKESFGRCNQAGYEPGVDFNGVPLYEEAWEEVFTAEPSLSPSDAPSFSPSVSPVCLFNHHFNEGTVIIDQPGAYKLCDDVIFCPSGGLDFDSATDEEIAEAFDPIEEGNPKYDSKEFALGFFAAIVVKADDVSISLNGHSISQCAEHALMQRFFAVIELASAPFTPAVGPHDFVTGDTFKAANNFKLTGPGTVGLSSHHGIHGNENNNVEISGVTFKNFEVGAVSLNNVKGLEIKNCDIPQNRHDVPILGSFSAALQIRPYIKALKANNPDFSMTLGGSIKTVGDVYDTLLSHIANVFRDVMRDGRIDSVEHPIEYQLYNNPHQVVDGPCYAFLVHGKGPAVGGFGEEPSTDVSALSANVSILDNNVANIKCFTNEVLAAVVGTRVQNDARGAILQFFDSSSGTYIGVNLDDSYQGNANLDAQIMTAKAMNTGDLVPGDILQTNVNSVDPSLISWAEGTDSSFTIADKFRCNGDSMHHVIKGSIMIRVEDCQGFDIRGNTIQNIEMLSQGPVGVCNDFHSGAAAVDATNRMLADLRGISVAAVSGYDESLRSGLDTSSIISDNTLTTFKSQNAELIAGVDIQGLSSDVTVENNFVNLNSAVGDLSDDKWVGLRVRMSAEGINVEDNNTFVQGMVVEMDEEVVGRRKLPEYHPNPNLLGGNEWPNNGCPFGH